MKAYLLLTEEVVGYEPRYVVTADSPEEAAEMVGAEFVREGGHYGISRKDVLRFRRELFGEELRYQCGPLQLSISQLDACKGIGRDLIIQEIPLIQNIKEPV